MSLIMTKFYIMRFIIEKTLYSTSLINIFKPQKHCQSASIYKEYLSAGYTIPNCLLISSTISIVINEFR